MTQKLPSCKIPLTLWIYFRKKNPRHSSRNLSKFISFSSPKHSPQLIWLTVLFNYDYRFFFLEGVLGSGTPGFKSWFYHLLAMQIQPCCYTATNHCFPICVMGIIVLPYLQERGEMQQAMYLAQRLARSRCSMNFSVYVCVWLYVSPEHPAPLYCGSVLFLFFTTYQCEYHRANHLYLPKHPDFTPPFSFGSNLFYTILFFIAFCNFHALCPFLMVYNNNIL